MRQARLIITQTALNRSLISSRRLRGLVSPPKRGPVDPGARLIVHATFWRRRAAAPPHITHPNHRCVEPLNTFFRVQELNNKYPLMKHLVAAVCDMLPRQENS